MLRRKIIEIDESKCDGCGQCVPSCSEGAIQVIGGKARLVADAYCDGLGACLGDCPHGAITIVEREAAPFDENLAGQHTNRSDQPQAAVPAQDTSPAKGPTCPGAAARTLPGVGPLGAPLPVLSQSPAVAGGAAGPGLSHWPVQLQLVPPQAPFLRGADLLLVADCVPLAFPDFHGRLLRGRPVAIACPKLDNHAPYVEKLARMIVEAPLRSLTVVHMEVPCCTALARIAEAACRASGTDLRPEWIVISVGGHILEPSA